jgi:hexosaminidase
MSKRTELQLLPAPRLVKRLSGFLVLPKNSSSPIKITRTQSAPDHIEGYKLVISKGGVAIEFREPPGLRAATATLRQLLRQFGRRLPCLHIRDWPDFVRRGVMLDISRGRVPKLETLLDFAEKLADLKINELQLYTEHTFAYRKYKSIWRSWGALTAKEIQILDARCRELGIDLVPNQNSFGHLRYFLADPRLKKLGELSEPYEADTRDFMRRPTTLAPNHPGTLPFLRGLFDELLPNFSSEFFNVGCDETWDLGKGQSKELCEQRGKGVVYFEFLKKIHREVSARGKTMMFWGDIILKYPGLIRELPKNAIALNWGYEAGHPFAKEAAQFAKAKIPFYVCPGTSTWQTLLGRHENAFANLRAAAKIGKKYGASGYLNTDWGDGGHPQPLAVSWPLFAAGAALAWNSSALDDDTLQAVLSRDIFEDSTGNVAAAAVKLGHTHLKLGVKAINETPLGTVIAAPRPEDRELFCRNGLKWFAKIPRKKIQAALKEIQSERTRLRRGKHNSDSSIILAVELDLAARMAEQSCNYMLWQQVAAAGQTREANAMAKRAVRELRQLEKDFNAYWPLRNKATTRQCSPFLKWRIEELSQAASF